MRILAIESSGTSGSVALLENAQVLVSQPLAPHQRSAQALAPAVQEALAETGWQSTDIELVAVTRGPGSFTGLRIGVTTAKTFAYAVNAALIGVNTLEVIARQTPPEHRLMQVVMDAQREELFTASYTRNEAGQLQEKLPTQLVGNEAWLTALQSGDVATGPGLKRLIDRIPPGVIVIDREHWIPTAAFVGQLGFEQFTAGRRDDPFQFVPDYFRRTAAEEQWERKHGDV